MELDREFTFDPMVAALHVTLWKLGYQGEQFPQTSVQSNEEAIVAINAWISQRRGRVTVLINPSTVVIPALISLAVERLVLIDQRDRQLADPT